MPGRYTRPKIMSASQALEQLRAGNRLFVKQMFGRTGATAMIDCCPDKLSGTQHPRAIILGCSDSRVPPELLFQQGPGDLFVIRVAGNIAAPAQIGSIEYAVEHFDTRLVVVLGHTCCAAVRTTMDHLLARSEQPISPNLRLIVDPIRRALDPLLATSARPDPEQLMREAVRANVRGSVRDILEGSAALARLALRDGLLIVGGEYSLATGEVRFFEPDGQAATP